MVDKNSAVPLYLQIQDVLYGQIRAGELVPGTQIPSELELANLYSVSRMTARRALDGLVSRGIVFRKQGKGTFVAENIMSYGLSTMLSFSGTLRARGHEVTTRVLRQEVIPAPQSLVQALELPLSSQVIDIRRLRYIDGKPAAIHTSYMDYRVYATILDVDLTTESLLAAIERISGTSMAYSRDSVRATFASVEDAALLEMPESSPVLEVEGVTFSESGRPSRLTLAVYRGDLFRLVVTNADGRATSLKVADIPDQSTMLE